MNLSLPLFDALDDAPPPLPQAGGGGVPGVGGPECAAREAAAAYRAADAGAAADADAGAAADDAAAAVHDPLAGGQAWAGLVARGALHPALWRASQIGGGAQRVTASGFDALDVQLPGGGWPHGVLTELLLPQPGIGELRLLVPALATLAAPAAAPGATAAAGRCVMLFDPPAALSAWALAQHGLASRHWLVVRPRSGHATPAGAAPWQPATAAQAPRRANRLAPLLPAADLLWALEQALRSGHLGAVLAWLPLGLRADALRRLQLAAQSHDGPVFVFRDAQARSQPSAAPLRLLLQPAGVDGLTLRLLKRRGPPLAQPLRLALPQVLTPQQQARVQARQALQAARCAP